jgi:hypothetical protein
VPDPGAFHLEGGEAMVAGQPVAPRHNPHQQRPVTRAARPSSPMKRFHHAKRC